MAARKQTSLAFDLVVCAALAIGFTGGMAWMSGSRHTDTVPKQTTHASANNVRVVYTQVTPPITLDELQLLDLPADVNKDGVEDLIRLNEEEVCLINHGEERVYTRLPGLPAYLTLGFSQNHVTHGHHDIAVIVRGEEPTLMWYQKE